MYKDKAKSNEAAKERMRRYRRNRGEEGVTVSGVTKGVTPKQGVTIPLIINDADDVPVIPKKYRDDLMSKESAKRLKSLPGDVQQGIEDVLVARRRLNLFDDSGERIERAERYQEWNTTRLSDRANIS